MSHRRSGLPGGYVSLTSVQNNDTFEELRLSWGFVHVYTWKSCVLLVKCIKAFFQRRGRNIVRNSPGKTSEDLQYSISAWSKKKLENPISAAFREMDRDFFNWWTICGSKLNACLPYKCAIWRRCSFILNENCFFYPRLSNIASFSYTAVICPNESERIYSSAFLVIHKRSATLSGKITGTIIIVVEHLRKIH